MIMTDTPPTKRSSRRRVLAVPETEPSTEQSTEPLSAPAAIIPEDPTKVSTLSPPAVDSIAAAPSLPPPPAAPVVTLREPGMATVQQQPVAPTPEPTLPNSPFHKHDVVQVLDVSSRHYGQFFMVGDVLNNKVHGYHLTAGMHKEFITVEAKHCWYIGSAKIRSAQPCSPKWISDTSRS